MDESQLDYNRWFRRIKTSHAMSRPDVVECCRIGGMEVSASMVDAWGRRAGGPDRRAAAMSKPQFEAFTAGLVGWRRSVEVDDDPDQ